MTLALQIEAFITILVKLTHARHIMFVTRVKKRASSYLLSQENLPEKLKTILGEFITCVANEDSAYQQWRRSEKTADIAAADQDRDALLNGLKYLVKGFLHYVGDDEKVAAAKLIDYEISLYDVSSTERYEDEGSKIRQLCTDLKRNNDLKQAVAKLGLTDLVDRLDTKNEEVITLVDIRTEERVAKDNQAMQKARAATEDAYRQLTALVNALALAEGDPDSGYSRYEQFIKVLNGDIQYYRTVVLQKRGDNDDPEPDPEPEPDDQSDDDGQSGGDDSGQSDDKSSGGGQSDGGNQQQSN